MEENKNEGNKNIEEIKRLFFEWASLPKVFTPEEVLSLDDEHSELLKIRSTKEFSIKYDIGYELCKSWNKEFTNSDKAITNTLNWAKRETPEVVKALIRESKKGDTTAIKIFLEKIAKIEDKTSLNFFSSLDEIRKRIENENK